MPASQRPRRDARATYRPSSTSARRRASSAASGEPGSMPTSAAARATSPSTASATALAAGRLLERRGVELGDALEVVLAPDELGRRRATSPARAPSSRASSSSAA